MSHTDHHVAVLGASRKPARYANQAIRLLLELGYRVSPVHPRVERIENLPVCHSLDAIDDPVHTLTLYVGAPRLEPLTGQIVQLNPGRVIFNPGTESLPVQNALDEAGIEWRRDCTLVMLRAGQFSARVGRYRPPQPRKSPYITRAGYDTLRAESKALWKKRRAVVRHLAAAAAEGDRSENAEYIYRKKQLRELDRRIRYLEQRLPDLKVVDSSPENTAQVYFGAWVTLETEDAQRVCYRIVGADEFDPKRNWISVDSPLARALLKRRAGDAFQLELAAGTQHYLVRGVAYGDPDAG